MRRECKIPRAELERRLAAGQGYRRIAAETGFGEASVLNRARRLGIPTHRADRAAFAMQVAA